MRQRAAERAAEERQRQDLATEILDGYTIRPAIGSTNGAANVGWELIPPKGRGHPWYLRTRDEAIAAIPRHLTYSAEGAR